MSNSLLSRTTSIRGRFAEKEQQEGFAVKRKNLPPMMQEREKDWSRRPVFVRKWKRQSAQKAAQKRPTIGDNDEKCCFNGA